MKRTTAILWLCGSAPTLLGHVGVLGFDTNPQIRIIAEMTEEGRKLPAPSPERPVIYFPVFAEEKIISREDLPPREDVRRRLKEALARSGYECVSPARDQPSQLLVFEWGEVVPQKEDGIFWNREEMMDLVVGQKPQQVAWWEHMSNVAEAVGTGRYFVRVKAYDYAAAKKKQQVLLWHARISSHTDGLTMAAIMPTLIKLGGPHFGREQSRPIVQFVPLEKPGRVELGEAEVIEYLPSKTGPDAEPAASKK